MPRFRVDVKAFMSLELERLDEATTRSAADRFVVALSAMDDDVRRHSAGHRRSGRCTDILSGIGGFNIDGRSEVETIND